MNGARVLPTRGCAVLGAKVHPHTSSTLVAHVVVMGGLAPSWRGGNQPTPQRNLIEARAEGHPCDSLGGRAGCVGHLNRVPKAPEGHFGISERRRKPPGAGVPPYGVRAVLGSAKSMSEGERHRRGSSGREAWRGARRSRCKLCFQPSDRRLRLSLSDRSLELCAAPVALCSAVTIVSISCA
jgi:hypothetical protein